MKQRITLLLLSGILLLTACQKEVSFENGGTPSDGSLQSDVSGDCLPKNVVGTYTEGVVLVGANNYIEVTVNVTTPGSYRIVTDTVNGISFKANGTFTATGLVTIKLTGAGTPQAAGTDNFIVSYGLSECIIQVTTLPSGASGPAVFTLNGAPNACINYQINGSYVVNTPLGASNTVVINVTVTTAGTYDITTVASNGMTFKGQGTLPLGNQTITLTGSGTPLAAGNTNIPVTTTGGSTCSFTCTVVATPPTVFDYFPRTAGSNWSYEYDDVANDSALVRVKAGTTVIAGNTYNVFEGTDNAASGFADIGWYRKAGNDYYRYTDLEDYLAFDASQKVEFIFIKDNLAANATWTTPEYTGAIGGTNLKIRIKFKILQKDVPITIPASSGSVTYANTIVVEEKYEVDLGTGWVDATSVLGYYKDYYARDKGWILDEYFDGTNPNAAGKMEVRRVNIAP